MTSLNAQDTFVPGRLQQMSTRIAFFIAGLGIARLPTFILGDALKDGRVVEILKDWAPSTVGLHLLTPPSPLRPARVEALMAFLTERLRDR